MRNSIAEIQEVIEHMESSQLDSILLEELRKETPNRGLIRLISSTLKQRDRDAGLVINPNIQNAWEKYQRKNKPVRKDRKRMQALFLKVASILLVLCTVISHISQEANAMNFFERFATWTEDIFSLMNPSEYTKQEDKYVFQTDNPGLQKVYDSVKDLGVSDPVVPMWLPEGYNLIKINVENTPSKTFLTSCFSNGSANILYQLEIYSENVTYNYYKDNSEGKTIEKNGTIHTVFRNNDFTLAVWTIENIQCSIIAECPEDALNQILCSIYTTEVN